MREDRAINWSHDLLLPTALFAVLGAMSWAVRGCSGYGAMMGCIFAGVLWGTAWWFMARDPSGTQSRRYTSGWIILALTFGIGISGARGWAQWPNFFEGHLQTNASTGAFVPISPAYGFLWLFIAGVPWAGIGACMLAWCGPARRLAWWAWPIRIACGIGGAWLAGYAFNHFPEYFLPLYKSMKAQYLDIETNPNLRRLTNDSRSAITHLGMYLGFLLFEAGRRDWKNVTLISCVGLVNGVGWALLQNWAWAADLWPGVQFNWWRCWESSGGISIGIAYGLAYFLVNRKTAPVDEAEHALRRNGRPNLERFGVYFGLLLGLGLSIRNGLKGWANIYLGNEEYWSGVFWNIVGPVMLAGMVAIPIMIWMRRLPKDYAGDVFPHAYRLMWLALIVQNILAQLVTGPLSNRNEQIFSAYYLMLLAVSGWILHGVHRAKRDGWA
ncbi:MAG: hypothetical protein HYV27_20705 [Candidatus Hydrogenedentes bacterium]|nr:hypothetical protein [Candidatus Hydrogenedentota bacterium]